MGDEDPTIADQVWSFRNRLEVGRLHYTYEIRTHYSAREEFRYLFTRFSSLPAIPLFWRERTVQANMEIVGPDGTKLPTLPSRISYLYSGALIDLAKSSLLGAIPPAARTSVADELSHVDPVRLFNLEAEHREKVADCLENLQGTFGSLPEYVHLQTLSNRLMDYYLPVVQAPRGESGDYLEVVQTVDVNTPVRKYRTGLRAESSVLGLGPWNLIRFLLIGLVEFELTIPIETVTNPPWKVTYSLHAQLKLPQGLSVQGTPSVFPVEAFVETKVHDRTSSEPEYSYSYVGADDAKRIQSNVEGISRELELASKVRADLFANLEPEKRKEYRRTHPKPAGSAQADPREPTIRNFVRAWFHESRLQTLLRRAVRPRVQVRATVDNGLRLVCGLFWIVDLVAYALALSGRMDTSVFVGLFSALILLTLTASVNTLDKPYVRPAVSAQVAMTLAAFLELPLLVLQVRGGTW